MVEVGISKDPLSASSFMDQRRAEGHSGRLQTGAQRDVQGTVPDPVPDPARDDRAAAALPESTGEPEKLLEGLDGRRSSSRDEDSPEETSATPRLQQTGCELNM